MNCADFETNFKLWVLKFAICCSQPVEDKIMNYADFETQPRLEKRFHKLKLDRSGSIRIGEFVSGPELKDNPLAKPKGFGFAEYDDFP